MSSVNVLSLCLKWKLTLANFDYRPPRTYFIRWRRGGRQIDVGFCDIKLNYSLLSFTIQCILIYDLLAFAHVFACVTVDFVDHFVRRCRNH